MKPVDIQQKSLIDRKQSYTGFAFSQDEPITEAQKMHSI